MRFLGRSKILLAALTAGLLLTACGSGPGQVGAAVITGDQVVSVTQVQQMLDKIIKDQPAAQLLAANHRLDLVSRELVSQLVVHSLLIRAATDEGLRVDEEQLGQLVTEDKLSQPVSANGSVPPTVLVQQLAASARDHREAYTDELLLQQLGEKAFHHLAITFDFTTISLGDPSGDSSTGTGSLRAGSLRENALSKAQQLASGPESEAKIMQADRAAGIGNTGQYLSLQNNDLAGLSTLFGFLPGSVVAFQPNPQSSSWLIAVVKNRGENTQQNADQTADQAPLVTKDYFLSLGRFMLQPLFNKVGTKISPRYGVWDPVAMQLAPNESETVGVVLKMKEAVKS